MPAFAEDVVEEAEQPSIGFNILKQRVDLDIDFVTRSLRGSTEITVQPLVKDLKQIRLHCRQCKPTLVQAGGITAKWDYDDPYRRLHMSGKTDITQHGMLRSKVEQSIRPAPEPELSITLPPKLKITELNIDPATALPVYDSLPSLQRQESDAMALAETPIVSQQPSIQFAPIKITIDFEVKSFRDGLHWIGCDGRDRRYPHLYTKLDASPGNTSAIVPCLDNANSRCMWEIAIRCPRTVGDAFRRSAEEIEQLQKAQDAETNGDITMGNSIDVTTQPLRKSRRQANPYYIELSAADAALELAVLCVGDMSDDVIDPEDETHHTVTYNLNDAVLARHVAFAIGPFEHIDLTQFRATAEEEKLGQTAVKVDGYCLPGRANEVMNTCFPLCMAVDFFGVNYGRFPFTGYQILFVDDLPLETTGAAGLSICSTRLLFPEEIIATLDSATRILIRTVAHQWSGVNIIPHKPADAWVTTGIAGFMSDVFMKKLAGNNEYRWHQKQAAEKVYDLDVDRPSMRQLGTIVHLDQSIQEFLDLKSALVLGILDRRLIKSSGSTGVTRIISKVFLNAKTGSLQNGELSTSDFQKTCEKLGHNKLESFFKQWVSGAGCPIFYVTQRFNKKKLMVELTIVQKQLERVTKPPFEPSNFMREIKEHVQEVWAPEPQVVFTGPMTIRIHEADGTPYEHIVEIKEALTRLEIPYNTKYKRLKRSKRQKERALAESNAAGEVGDDALLYCLGDILDTPEDIQDWNLAEWSKEDEERMGQESYEWIRMDADFEWIGKIHLVMPLYMYISQLQQDRDIVAQYESMRYLLGSNPHHVSLSILVRTLMDSRYFHGIRVMAADGLAIMAKDRLRETGQFHLEKAFTELFCDTGSHMPRPNDFSSRQTLIIQSAIPIAMSRLRDEEGKVPEAIRKFFIDKLRFNDNTNNEYSDVHYIATLMTCLADALVVSHRKIQPSYHFGFDDDESMEAENPNAELETLAFNEIDRYRKTDEWITSYQNIYSTTAIECLQKLKKAGIVEGKTRDLMLYTQQSTPDNVRLAAFRCLNEIGYAHKPSMWRHVLHSLIHDPSPYFRDGLLKIFGETLGHLALDETAAEPTAPPPVSADGLVLEAEVSNEALQLEATRRTTPEGAIQALKVLLENDTVFAQTLWYAATADDLTLEEVVAFCDIAALVFPSVTSHMVVMKLPRAYKCQHLGAGKLRFVEYGPFRTKPKMGLKLEDWHTMQRLHLNYTGPLSTDVSKYQKDHQRNDDKMKNLEAQIKNLQQLQQETLLAQEAEKGLTRSTSFTDMPPPSSDVTAARTGIKLNLAGKRKASIDLSTQEPPIKPIKIAKSTVSNGTTPAPKKLTIPKQRRSSTPASRASFSGTGSLVVVLRLSLGAAEKARKIIAADPQPAATPGSATQKSRSITPALPQQTPPASVKPESPNSVFSPPPPGLATGTSQKLNLGGFRSFGPTPEPSNGQLSLSASPTEIKQEGGSAAQPLSLTNGGSITSPSLTASAAASSSLTSMSPPAAGEAAIPAKPKFTLKLSRKPSGMGQASP